jgi:CheY-like chemotaxis protein
MPTVLIADDQESIRTVIRVTLDSGHVDILEAADGLTADDYVTKPFQRAGTSRSH